MSLTARSGETFPDMLSHWGLWMRLLANRIARKWDIDNEDVQQELITALLIAFPRFDSSKGSFGNFVMWTARGVYTRYRNKLIRAVKEVDWASSEDGPFGEQFVDFLADPEAPCPEVEANRRDLIARVRREVDRLSPRYRECIYRYFGLDGMERNGRLDRGVLERGLQRLRTRMEQRGKVRAVAG